MFFKNTKRFSIFSRIFIILFQGAGLERHAYHEMYVEVRGQPSGIVSLLPPMRSSGLLAMSLTAEPPHWPRDLLRMKKQVLPGVRGGR